jgi:hypothetical protein
MNKNFISEYGDVVEYIVAIIIPSVILIFTKGQLNLLTILAVGMFLTIQFIGIIEVLNFDPNELREYLNEAKDEPKGSIFFDFILYLPIIITMWVYGFVWVLLSIVIGPIILIMLKLPDEI